MEDICISLGSGARFLVRRGFAREQTLDELLAVLERARGFGLTHVTDNIRHKPSFICNCCACCCELMAGVQAGYLEGVAKAPYLARVEKGDCSSCGLCVKTCNVAALELGGEGQPARLREEVCLGCGACVGVCLRGALRLVDRPRRYRPPLNRTEMMKKRLFERGRGTSFLISGMKKKIRRLFRRKPRKRPEIP